MGRRDGNGRVPVGAEPPRGGGVSLGDALRKAGIVPAAAGRDGGTAVGRDAPSRPAEDAKTGDARADAPDDLSACGKVVLRRERKGHGGHPVTRIEGLGLGDEAMADLAREVARGMGCGARAEGDAIVVAGEPGERLEAWLRARGVRKVVRGN